MAKSKRPAQRQSGPSLSEDTAEKDEALTRKLVDLANDLAGRVTGGLKGEAKKQKEAELVKAVGIALYQRRDEVLYEALERTREADGAAFHFLKDRIEDAADNLVIRQEKGGAVEVTAFVIPVIVRSGGGLDAARAFQDEEAFEQLTASIKAAQLESPDATVVLVAHAYHADEFRRITYSGISDMIRDAHASMTSKKMVPTPAIERSISGWPQAHFDADDVAVELRFLLGFALKSVDDSFYHVPENEAKADAYFEKRMARFEHWTGQATPLVKRCLGIGADDELSFLYQDIFHGGKDRGMAEYAMLQMMSDLDQQLHERGAAPEAAAAVIGPAESEESDETVLRVNMHADDLGGALLASSEKPLGVVRDLRAELDDVCDALATMGVKAVSVAARFDGDGRPVDARPYANLRS